MIQKKIEVLFFSKMKSFSHAIAELFSDEVEFNFQCFSTMVDFREYLPISQNPIAIVDLTNNQTDFVVFLKKSKEDFFSFSFIFILEDQTSRVSPAAFNLPFFEIIYKPINLDNLLIKIRSQVSDYKKLDDSPVVLGENYFYPRTNEIKNTRGKSIRLTEKETEIINFLCKERGRILTKDALLKGIWGYKKTITTHTLETHIYRLRKKIEFGLGETDLILNNNRGYYLDA